MTRSMYACDALEVATALNVDPRRGLAAGEAVRRSMHFGRNVVHHSDRWLNHAAIGLVAVGAVAGLARSGGAALAIVATALLAIAALEATRLARPPRPKIARVLCDGAETIVGAADLVPGDVIVIDAEMDVAADARIVSAEDLIVDESRLTGTRDFVRKSAAVVPAGAPLAARRSMIYSGTHVVSGHGTAIVTATGDATELGRLR